MLSAAIYRGNVNGYLDFGIKEADMAYEAVTGKIDDHGLAHEVSGCPDFLTQETSCRSTGCIYNGFCMEKQVLKCVEDGKRKAFGQRHT